MGETDKYLDAFRSTLPVLIDKEMTKVRKQQRGLILMVCVLLGTNLLLLGGAIWVLTVPKTEVPAIAVTPVENTPEAEEETAVFTRETLIMPATPIPIEPAETAGTTDAGRAGETGGCRSTSTGKERFADPGLYSYGKGNDATFASQALLWE